MTKWNPGRCTEEGHCTVTVERNGEKVRVLGLEYMGERKSLEEWAVISGLLLEVIKRRRASFWSAEAILTTDIVLRKPPTTVFSKLRKEQNGDHI